MGPSGLFVARAVCMCALVLCGVANAADSCAERISLRARGEVLDGRVASVGTRPMGAACLLVTLDAPRDFYGASHSFTAKVMDLYQARVGLLEQDAPRTANEVLSWFTGRVSVKGLDIPRILPFMIANDLTSTCEVT